MSGNRSEVKGAECFKCVSNDASPIGAMNICCVVRVVIAFD